MNFFRQLFRRRLLDEELAGEVEAHILERIDELMESGVDRDAAEAQAHREFGSVTASLERSRDTWSLPTVESVFKDIRYGLRSLRKSSGTAAVIILTLALGIGANAAIFGLIDGLWFHPMGVPRPGEMARVFSLTSQEREGDFSYPEYRAFAEQANAFSGVVACGGRGARIKAPDGTHQLLLTDVVSNNFFETLGIKPAVGRLFDPSDPATLKENEVVLGYTFWQRHFGGRRDIAGKPLEVERGDKDVALTIVGVLPSSFREIETGEDRDLWMPPELGALFYGKEDFSSHNSRWFRVVARLAPGASIELARRQVETIATRLARDWPANNKGRSANVVSDLDYRLEQAGANGIALISVAFLVVLLCCLNVANLLLARNVSRRTEFAVRLALGVDRWRLARQLMTENALLGLAGLALGLAIGSGLIKMLPALFVSPPGFDSNLRFHFDIRVFAFATAMAVAALVLFGFVPAWRASKVDPGPTLKGVAPAQTGHRLRSWLVVSQICISLVLLAGSGVLVESLIRARSSMSGYAPKPLLLPWLAGIDAPKRASLEPVLDRIRALPQVKNVAYAIRSPLSLSGEGWSARIVVPGRSDMASQIPAEIKLNTISSNFLELMGTPLMRGRGFNELDQTSGPLAVLINEDMARRYWPGENPIDKTIRLVDEKNAEYRVVGVVRNAPINQIGERPEPYMYFPFWRKLEGEMTLVIDAGPDPLPLAQPIRRMLVSFDKQYDPFTITTFSDLLRFSTFRFQLSAELVSALGLLALVITAIGLYGVVSFSVSWRSREIGIRMALGAGRGDTLGLVLKEVGVLAGWGVIIGIPCAIVSIRAASALLFGVGPWDVKVFGLVLVLLAAILFVAGFIPARRATSINPTSALRYE